MSTTWKNRIVKTAEIAPDQLLANEKNWRIHPKFQQDALSAVLDQVGWVQRVMVNINTDTVIDGHLRVSLALQRNEKTVPVEYVDLTPDEEALILATFDPLAAMAAADAEQLDALLHDISTDSADIQQMLSELAENTGIVPPEDFDPHEEWTGMPEFEQDDLNAAFKAIVNFATAEDQEQFEQLVGQRIPRNTKSIWFPKQERQNVRDMAYVSNGNSDDDSDDDDAA